jgi:hypothetical protein
MSDLGALSLGLVIGLCVVGAVLLRREEEIRKAWRRRRGIVEPDESLPEVRPETPAIRAWQVAFQGLMVVLLVSHAVLHRDALRIVVAALSISAFGVFLFKYRRSRPPLDQPEPGSKAL